MKVFHLLPTFFWKATGWLAIGDVLPSVFPRSLDFAVTLLPLVFAFSEADVVALPTTSNVIGVPTTGS